MAGNGLTPPENSVLKHLYSLWNMSSFFNSFREFLLKFFNNQLGLNSRTIHFGGTDRCCTFCRLSNRTVDETFVHLFFECPTTRNVQDEIENTLLEPSNDDIYSKKCRWFGFTKDNNFNIFRSVFYLHVQFLLWQFKLKKTLPDPDFIVGESIYALDLACKLNFKIMHDRNNFFCPLTRYWDILKQRGDG